MTPCIVQIPANDASKLPPMTPETEALFRAAYAKTHFVDHGISFETVCATPAYVVALVNIAAHLRETGRL